MYSINRCSKYMIYFGLICFISIMLCGCKDRAGSTDVNNNLPELIIGGDDFEPYNYRDENGSFAGIDVEIAQEACRRMGYTPVFKSIIWNDKDKYLESGEIDCAWAGFSMNGMEDDYTWVGPYMRCDEVVMVQSGSDIYTLQDLEGKNVAVQSQSHEEYVFLNYTAEFISIKNLYCFSEKKEMFASLRKGYVDACAGHDSAIREYLEQYGSEYRILDESISSSLIGIAFSKNKDIKKAELLRQAVKDMQEDGTIKSILEKYGLLEQSVCGGDE